MKSKIQKYIAFVFLPLLFVQFVQAQLPAEKVNKAGFRKSMYGGFQLHTSGWGATFTYSKFATYKKKTTYTVDLVKMKHPKEIKIQGTLDEAAKDFVYGKLNSLLVLRLGYGKKNMIYEKLRDKGVNIFHSFSFGPSFGLVKPVYLDVNKINAAGTANLVSEKYDPEHHHLGNINGQTRGINGLAELKAIPGLFLKTSLEFEYGEDRSFIKSIEVGAALDVYLSRVPIMANIENDYIYPTVFINLMIGKRFF